ncbi:hypothetical protein HUJ04_002923 [Dendroctonus ponderosae]|nr:hypothetical protein HUJ04_002923 [Dendroctonus ponderosae]
MKIFRVAFEIRGLAKAGEPNNISPTHPGVISLDKSVYGTLRRKQRRLSRENTGLLEAVARGVSLAIIFFAQWSTSIKDVQKNVEKWYATE